MENVILTLNILQILCTERIHYWLTGDHTNYIRSTLRKIKDTNILSTKIYQAIATKQHVLQLSPEYIDEIQTYTNYADYDDSEINEEALQRVATTYDIEIDRIPIHSGMIALAFAGRKRQDNQKVIIKLKRKGIRSKLVTACNHIKFLFGICSQVYPDNIYIQIVQPFVMNIDDIIEQCDFEQEIKNLAVAKRENRALPHIIIPECYNNAGDCRDPEFILMEYLEGANIYDRALTTEEAYTYFKLYTEFIFYAHMHQCMFHTDLHSGNLLLMNGAIGIIDFGMVLYPSPKTVETSQNILVLMSSYMNTREEEKHTFFDEHRSSMIDEFKYLFEPPLDELQLTDAQYDRVNTIILDIMVPLIVRNELDELDITAHLTQLSSVCQSPLHFNMDVYKILLGCVMTEGVAKSILNDEYENPKRMQIIKEIFKTHFAS